MAVTIRGSGQVPVQIVNSALTSVFSTTSASYVDTGITATITPTNASNKVLISVSCGASTNIGAGVMFFQLLANGTPIMVGDTAGSRISCSASSGSYGNLNAMNSVAIDFLHLPATTSAVVYKLQIKTNNAQVAKINASYGDSDSADYPRTVSTINLMELSGT